MIRISYYVFFVCGLVLMSLTFCNRDKDLPAPSHAFLTVAEFNKLSRAEQVKNCGSCHPKEYENELKGPHANAYRMLMAHEEYIGKGEGDLGPYCAYYTNTKAVCSGCHATQNMFETGFRPFMENDFDSLRRIKKWKPQVRTDKASLITGVDCLTCHYDGNNVVAATDIRHTDAGKTNCPTFCSPKRSNILASNMGCVPCHMEQEIYMDNSFVSSAIKTNDCNKCHAEYDDKNKFTHYYYWAHDPADKIRPKHLDMFSGITCNINSSRNELNVSWNNTLLPHPVSVCTELKAFIKVFDQKGKLLAQQEISANKKPEQDVYLQKYYGDIKVPGTHTTDISAKGNYNYATKINLGAAQAAPVKVVIEGVKKEQYWLSDTLGTGMHHREFSL